jgi:dihydroorotate dehydrogenase electron transfer subunit
LIVTFAIRASGVLEKLSDYRTAVSKMRTVKLLSVTAESPMVKSFMFNDELCAKGEPGQFVMVWIPGVDEVPMSLSTLNSKNAEAAITVERVGEATKALHNMKAGDTIGVRGPFGNSYTVSRTGKVMIVGGGTGLASLAPLAERLAKETTDITFLMGAKTRSDLLFHEPIESLLSRAKGRLLAATEDGSYGDRGLVTTLAEKIFKEGKKFNMVYTCGPERMMQKMFLLAERYNVPFEASLERFMRCAIGLCGTCVIGKYRVCQDGPVFTRQRLREVKDEFGRWRRGFDGVRIRI